MSSSSSSSARHAATPGSPGALPDPHPVVRSDEYLALSTGGPDEPRAGSSDVPVFTPTRGAAARVTPVRAPQRVLPDDLWPDAMWTEPRRVPAPVAEEPVVDFGQLRALAGFPLRAVRRRRRLASAVAGVVLGVAALVALIAPRQYDVQTSILAQRNFVMPALGNPRRAVPAEGDAPTKLAAEAVLNRENVLDIIDKTGLDAAWPRLRSPAGRAKEALRALFKPPYTRAERRDLLVNYLLSQIWVTSDDGTVQIGVHFPDPQLAVRVVEVAGRNFLDKRHASEVSLIQESIGILESHVAGAHTAIDSALGDVRRFSPPARRPAPPLDFGAPRPAPRNPAVGALENDLAARRAALATSEDARARRIAAAQARLAEVRQTLGPAHPDVISAQQAVDALATDPPELGALRTAVRDAEARVAQAGGSTTDPSVARRAMPSDAAVTSAALVRLATQAPDTLEDPRLTYARSRLKMAVADYEDLLDRLESARIELETAKAAFKYRYSVLRPPQYPKGLSKPKMPLLVVGGVFAAVMLGAFAALVMDLGSGRVVEGWQVPRFVGLPVIGETPPV